MSSGGAKTRGELLQALKTESRKSTLDGVFLLQAVAERSGMNLTDLQCVAVLTSTGPITAGQLAEKMGLTTGAVTGVVNRLERAGYVRREPDPKDGRRVIIRPVLEMLEQGGAGFFGSPEGDMDALLEPYGDRDLELFLDFMQRANIATQAEIAKLRAAPAGKDGGEFSAPLGAVERGRLVFVNGASRLTLRTLSGTDDLYRARFEGAAPKVEVESGTVTVHRSRRFKLFDVRQQSEEVVLNSAVPWEIEVRGGAVRLEADLEGLELSSFVFKGGVVDFSLVLPEPSGEVPVRLSGGVSKAKLTRPSGAEARLGVQGGVVTLTFDEQSFRDVGGKVQLQTSGYQGASNRYDIDISGGAIEIAAR